MTDITYIPTAKGMVYLCTVVDLCGKMVLSYRVGNDMISSLVTDTNLDAMQKRWPLMDFLSTATKGLKCDKKSLNILPKGYPIHSG